MRAEMKLATGLVPVTMGLTMALLSGMAKAEEKTAQAQPLSDVVSAQTSLASVGHRPYPYTRLSWMQKKENHLGQLTLGWYSEHNPLRAGDVLSYSVPSNSVTADTDNRFGASEKESAGCDIYRDDKLIISKDKCMSELSGSLFEEFAVYKLQNEDVGHVITIDVWRYTDRDSTPGYIATPDKSQAITFSSSIVRGGFSPSRSMFKLSLKDNTASVNEDFTAELIAYDTEGNAMNHYGPHGSSDVKEHVSYAIDDGAAYNKYSLAAASVDSNSWVFPSNRLLVSGTFTVTPIVNGVYQNELAQVITVK